ncbi:A-adding tRNA nucleotidyltransferase [Aquifex aeolicus]|uniref:A-adding tRNA nucleotidyltransferase n=1 Tax=Aquifex aeolicus (strain VF5) TaxID=224324 RepID=AATNT_AQUAE|nr:A-adding tRNA nucleotidyltransferase [Aquifex aeolicus]O66728.1 RecName: Full=A-adding tRNA nucleotidyltransferase; Short=A-adding TNT; AltName: Full=A-adding enzyme [Aquifex aeolicus VF5]AAC06692.1 poly A polymerase [Aquifex aeolicus VF5]
MVCPKVVILSEGADLDSLSAAYGVLKLYPDAYLLKPKHLSKKAGEVFKKYRDKFRVIEDLPDCFELVLVDTHFLPEGLPRERIKRIIVYDHHPIGDVKEFEGKIEKVGAATTLVVEEIKEKGIDINPRDATLLAFGIYEDTGNFTYEGTTPRDALALAFLLEKGANLREIREVVMETYTPEQIEAVGKIVQSIEKVFINGRQISFATAVLERYQPDINTLLYEIKDLKESDAFFVIIEAEGKTYVFGRSQSEDVDVGEILSHFGGGGHREAGAVKLENVSAERIKELIKAFLKRKYVKLKVRDIMNTPPFVLEEHVSVKDALTELSERGIANAPVINREGKLVGIISKKALLKLVKLYPDEPIELFVNRDFYTLSPDAPVWEAEEILTKFGQKLIPVVEDGTVVGVVTRLDILQAVKEDLEKLKEKRRKIKVPENIEEIAREVGQIAKEMGLRAYIVGGVVRDILLGKEVWDVDFVVEGNAIELAKELARRHGVNVHPFPEFGTAHLKIGKLKLEFATARRETYPRPGAYPKVEPASLKEDLIRRDFTINAMAISVNLEDYGTLIDYFGGLRDLKDKVIRVLHPVSFIEDPVRILRALRFAGRLNFKLSRSTEKLLKQAVNLGLLKEAPRGRLINEIKLALREDRFLEILELYRKYRVLEEIIEGFQWNEKVLQKLYALRKVVDWHALEFSEERIDYGWLYLLILISNLDYERGKHFLEEMSAPSWVRETYKFMKFKLGSLKEELKKAKENYEVYRLLKPLHTSVLLLLMLEEELKEKIKLYLEKLRKVKLPKEKIEELKKQGLKGKELGERIEELKREIMNKI